MQLASEVILIRHGETEWSATGRHTGRTDVVLSAAGEEQAKSTGSRLAQYRFGLVLSSPLVRARRTAELAGLTNVQVDDDLQEWDYGGYEGLTTAEIRERHPGWLLWHDGVVPGRSGNCESVADVGARADRVIARIEPTLTSGSDVALVAHGHFLRVLAARWLALPPAAGGYFALAAASISVLGFEHDQHVIRQWNEAPSA